MRGLLGYRCHARNLPGEPDIAFTRWRLAIFVDGAFWHGHPDHFRYGHLGHYWDEKISRTRQRDALQHAELEELGFKIVRFWDFEVRLSAGLCAEDVFQVKRW